MPKPKSRKSPEFSKCEKCDAVAVVMGGDNPKLYLVDKGICISCVAEVVGRYSAEVSYKRITAEGTKKKLRRRKPKAKKTVNQ